MSRGVEFEKYDLPMIDEKGISTAGGAKAAWFSLRVMDEDEDVGAVRHPR